MKGHAEGEVELAQRSERAQGKNCLIGKFALLRKSQSGNSRCAR